MPWEPGPHPKGGLRVDPARPKPARPARRWADIKESCENEESRRGGRDATRGPRPGAELCRSVTCAGAAHRCRHGPIGATGSYSDGGCRPRPSRCTERAGAARSSAAGAARRRTRALRRSGRSGELPLAEVAVKGRFFCCAAACASACLRGAAGCYTQPFWLRLPSADVLQKPRAGGRSIEDLKIHDGSSLRGLMVGDQTPLAVSLHSLHESHRFTRRQ